MLEFITAAIGLVLISLSMRKHQKVFFPEALSQLTVIIIKSFGWSTLILSYKISIDHSGIGLGSLYYLGILTLFSFALATFYTVYTDQQ